MADQPQFIRGIYGILPDAMETVELLQKANAALAGGVKTLQLRDKNRGYKDTLKRAKELCRLVHSHDARFIVNDSLQLALDCEADGVHLGRNDMQSLASIRAETGSQFLIGISCQGDAAFARHVLQEGADYVSFGAIFATESKQDAVPIGLARLEKARQLFPEVNICAIGGITQEALPDVRKAGADCAAVISSLFGAGDVGQRARMMVEAWNNAPSA
jgi:thiamine-phosphate pyrophosphorylase